MSGKKEIKQNKGITDARTLGGGKMLVLGLQHMFAMFGEIGRAHV